MLKYFDMLKEAGSVKAAQIDTSTIVTAPWTIYKCRYGCDFYGKSYCCPPHVPTWKETQEIIDCYHYGILFNLNEDSCTGVTPLAVEIAREAFLDGYYKAIPAASAESVRWKTADSRKKQYRQWKAAVLTYSRPRETTDSRFRPSESGKKYIIILDLFYSNN